MNIVNIMINIITMRIILKSNEGSVFFIEILENEKFLIIGRW